MTFTRGDILFVTAADTEILGLALAREKMPADFPAVRALHLRELTEPGDLEEFAREIVPRARVLVARILGGRAYFPEGFDLLSRACRENGVPFLAMAGGREIDPELSALGSVPLSTLTGALEYFVHGGVDNYGQLLRFLADRFLLTGYGSDPATPTPERGVYEAPGLPSVPEEAPVVGVLFYRAHWLSGNLQPIDALARELHREGCRARAVFCESLKEADEDGTPLAIREYLMDADVLISTLAFSSPHGLDCPVIQAVMSGSTRAEWSGSAAGLSPRDVAMHVALPEFDGRIISVPISFKDEGVRNEPLGAELRRNIPLPGRVAKVARLAKSWSVLRRTPNGEKRVAILFNNYPTRNARVGNGVGLDTPESVIRLLRALEAAGYDTGPIPENGDDLIHTLLAGCTHDDEFQTPENIERTSCKLDPAEYAQRFGRVPPSRREEMIEQWGSPPGTYMMAPDGMAIPGLRLGNVFIGIQPSRGFGVDSGAIYHSPDLPPTHFYLGYYQWIAQTFGAHAVIHVGKHGNLEWLPGKGIGLSETCYPEIVLGSIPNIYPYIINNPGEGTQAKRRSHAVIVDHMIPPMTRAESYGDLIKLEHLADEYAEASTLDPSKCPLISAKLIALLEESKIYRDLAYERPPAENEVERFIEDFDGYLCEIKESQIRDGLHILGALAEGDRLIDLLVSLVRLDQSGVRGLPAAIADDLGLDHDTLAADPAQTVEYPHCRTAGDLIEVLEIRAREAVRENRAAGPESARTLAFLNEDIRPRLAHMPEEISNILTALEGRFVPAGPSGAPTRGMANILPTGRNFYSVDIRAIPSQTACEVGRRAAEGVLERYLKETGDYPRSIGIVVWGTSNMRTGGDDIGEILHLLGMRPVWQGINRRVIGLEVIPLEELGRPRIDVLIRISGFFRDAFPNVVELLDEAVRTVAGLDEPAGENFVRANIRADIQGGRDPESAAFRIFGSKPGSYGAGLLNLIDERNWTSDKDLAEVYVSWGGYAYGRGAPGVPAFGEFRRRLAGVSVALQNQDNREHDIFDSDDYFQFHGGMIAAVRSITGENPKAYFGDTSKPDRVKIRSLREEAVRVFRSRVVNPKWIESIQRHGYRGACELAATVDYLFGYDVTAHVIDSYMYEQVTEAYILDEGVRQFLEEKNPWALRGMVERLLEAQERGYWESPPEELTARLKQIYLENEAGLEVMD
ncbi:MAG: cobaltochelatase subunit CobN [Nitrospinota bacterium]